MTLRFTILGCGSSGGVPRIGGDWGKCDPSNPRNLRRRCSMLVERITGTGTTRVLIDSSPDMRAQLLDAGVGTLDAVVMTHEHADHCHGMDDLRMVVMNTGRRVDVWMTDSCAHDIRTRFAYAFETPEGSAYPPILEHRRIDGPIEVDGAGGPLTLHPFEVEHGRITALGFRVGGLAYLPDVNHIPTAAWPAVEGLDIWVVDALRRKPHPSHSHLAQTLGWIDRARPALAVLTNLHNDLDYETLRTELPANVDPAHDMMVLELDDA
ncbi:MBL fold metallo-hydrolase [Palleronia sp.]|uniref:MBL fold metallo-hydrolase n=1 Tax=Palleronia sp. TaxID=1940284 RepID=UPI0035C87340